MWFNYSEAILKGQSCFKKCMHGYWTFLSRMLPSKQFYTE